MPTRVYLICILIFFSGYSFGQVITLINPTDNRPIADVFIYHENEKSVAYSDLSGNALLKDFPTGMVYLQHPSYESMSVQYLGSDLKIKMTEKVIIYSDVVVSANKWEQNEENVSQEIVAIDRKTIDFQNPQTSADVLAGTGQVFIQKSQLGGGSPKLRGFAANAVLLIVDGVRMNNAIFRSGNLQNVINIDANALRSAEVVFGPGSVLYGSDALGGVMDFHTIDPSFSVDEKIDIKTNVMARYSTAANEKTGHFDVSVANQKWTFFQSFSYSNFDDLQAGSIRSGGYEGEFLRSEYAITSENRDALVSNDDPNLQLFSGYNLTNSISKFKLKVNDNIEARYGFYFSSTSDIPRYDNLTERRPSSDSLEHAEWFYGPQKWQMHNLGLTFSNSNTAYDKLRITLAAQSFEESRSDRTFGSELLRTQRERVFAYSLSADFDKLLGRTDLYYGFDAIHNSVNSTAQNTNIETLASQPTSTRYPDDGSTYSSLAAYASSSTKLNNKMALNLGIRYSAIMLDASTRDETAISRNASELDLNNSALNGSMGLAYALNENNKLSTNFASGFRAPNIDDVGKVFEVGSTVTVPNTSLKPEFSYSGEVAFERKGAHTFFKLVGFMSLLRNAIVDGPFSVDGESTISIMEQDFATFSKVNAGRARLYGGSLIFQQKILPRLAFNQAISFTEGEEITTNEPLRHTTPVFGRSTLTYKKNKLRLESYVDFNTSRNLRSIPSAEIDRKPHLYTENGSPGWYTLNFKSSFAFNEYLTFDFGLENMLDKHYRPYTSGISAPGRNFIFTLRGTI
ncbi:MAG: TonB-dependent receptor [Bacteroidota bacterium]